MSDANRTALRIVEESTFNTTPASPEFKDLRFNSSSLSGKPKTVVSNQVRSDRQVQDLILVGEETGGDISSELVYGNYDMLMEGSMFNAWVKTPEITVITLDTEISNVDATTDTLTLAAGGAAFKAGMLIYGSGFAQANNNRVHRVTSSTATTVVVGDTTATEASIPVGAKIKVCGFRGASADITATASGLGATVLDFTTLGLVAGMWVKIGGTAVGERFATAACNGWARVSAIAAAALTFDVLPTGWTTDVGTGKTISVYFGDYLRNGVLEKSYTFEQYYGGMPTPEYEYFKGMEVSSLSFDLEAQALVTVQASFMGATSVAPSVTRLSGATTVPAETYDVINTSSNVAQIREGGAVLSAPNYCMSLKLQIENSLREQNSIGNLSATGIGVGRCKVTGSVNTYFGSSSLLSKIRNNTSTSLDFVIKKDNQALVFDMPKVKYATESHSIEGVDTDMMLDLSFQALVHGTLGYTMQIQRMPYYEE